MSPYYEDDSVTLYHGDCREVTEWLAADVLVTDPPYGTESAWPDGTAPDVNYGRGQNRRRGAQVGTIANDATSEVRDCALLMWGEKPTLVFGSPRRHDPPGAWVDRLVWDKKRAGMNGGPWRYTHESIFVSAGFVRKSNASVSIITAYPDQRDHIHAKPVALMTKLLDCAPDGTVADPFAGSGSTLVAAKQLGRKAIGVELEERYCEIAARRLAQDTLFGGAA